MMFFFSSRRRHTRYWRDWSSDVCSSDLAFGVGLLGAALLPSSQREREAARTVKEKAQPLGQQLGEKAKEVAQDLREPAQDALQSVKATATEAAQAVKEEGAGAAQEVKGEDRKSTRLNSSHANISYAVFCLKEQHQDQAGPCCARLDARGPHARDAEPPDQARPEPASALVQARYHRRPLTICLRQVYDHPLL